MAQAIQIILSVLILALVIIIFYIWLNNASDISKQQSVIGGVNARYTFDKALANMAHDNPADFQQTPEHLETRFNAVMRRHLIVEDIDCEREAILRCEFEVKTSNDADYITDHQTSVYLPSTTIKEIRFVGEVYHE